MRQNRKFFGIVCWCCHGNGLFELATRARSFSLSLSLKKYDKIFKLNFMRSINNHLVCLITKSHLIGSVFVFVSSFNFFSLLFRSFIHSSFSLNSVCCVFFYLIEWSYMIERIGECHTSGICMNNAREGINWIKQMPASERASEQEREKEVQTCKPSAPLHAKANIFADSSIKTPFFIHLFQLNLRLIIYDTHSI